MSPESKVGSSQPDGQVVPEGRNYMIDKKPPQKEIGLEGLSVLTPAERTAIATFLVAREVDGFIIDYDSLRKQAVAEFKKQNGRDLTPTEYYQLVMDTINSSKETPKWKAKIEQKETPERAQKEQERLVMLESILAPYFFGELKSRTQLTEDQQQEVVHAAIVQIFVDLKENATYAALQVQSNKKDKSFVTELDKHPLWPSFLKSLQNKGALNNAETILMSHAQRFTTPPKL